MKFKWIHEHRQEFPVQPMCDVLGVCKSGYYASLKRPASERTRRRTQLTGRVIEAFHASGCVYGSPRVHKELVASGETVCRNTVAKIMKQQRIRSVVSQRFVPCTTDSNHPHPVAPNRLDRDFVAELPNQKWAADITYVQTNQGTLYLAAVIDLCSRKIVGWSMNDRMPVELVVDALKMALARRRPDKGLLHHSDRGVQYACGVYQDLLHEHGIT